jgi:hypothetical protein
MLDKHKRIVPGYLIARRMGINMSLLRSENEITSAKLHTPSSIEDHAT